MQTLTEQEINKLKKIQATTYILMWVTQLFSQEEPMTDKQIALGRKLASMKSGEFKNYCIYDDVLYKSPSIKTINLAAKIRQKRLAQARLNKLNKVKQTLDDRGVRRKKHKPIMTPDGVFGTLAEAGDYYGVSGAAIGYRLAVKPDTYYRIE